MLLSLLLDRFTFSGIRAGAWCILFSGVVSTAFGFTAQVIGQRMSPSPSRAAVILTSESLFSLLGGVLWNLVGSGDILPINDYLTDDIMARMEPGLLVDMTFDGKVYQLPYTKAASMLYCNTELFEKYGVKIPETWDELITAVETFRANGVTPMALGGGDQWPTNMYTEITVQAVLELVDGTTVEGDVLTVAFN